MSKILIFHKKYMKKILWFIISLFAIWATHGLYLDTDFWTANPTNTQIIERIYGVDSTYDDNWIGTGCTKSAMSVVRVKPGTAFAALGRLKTSNKVYVLLSGDHKITSSKGISGTCIAVVWQHNNANLFQYTATTWTIASGASMVIYGQSRNIIVDGLDIDWAYNLSWYYGKSTDGIVVLSDDSSNSSWNIANVTINNNSILNNDYGIDLQAWDATQNISNIIVTNNFVSGADLWGFFLQTDNASSTGIFFKYNTFTNNVVWGFIYDLNTGNRFVSNVISNNTTWVDSLIHNLLFDLNIFTGNTANGFTGTNMLTAIPYFKNIVDSIVRKWINPTSTISTMWKTLLITPNWNMSLDPYACFNCSGLNILSNAYDGNGFKYMTGVSTDIVSCTTGALALSWGLFRGCASWTIRSQLSN